MAINQVHRHQVSRLGEGFIARLLGGEPTTHKAPFDIVDFAMGTAYEVKAMSGLSKDLKIHISSESMKKKKQFAKQYGLKAILIAVVIYSEEDIKVYKSSLKSSVRISQMRRIKS